MHYIYTFIIILLTTSLSISQSHKTLHGKIHRKDNTPISDALIINVKDNISCISDMHGNFRVIYKDTIDIRLIISHIKHQTIDTTINISSTDLIKITLKDKIQNIKEVNINAKKISKSLININASHLNQLPISSNGAVEQLIKTLSGVSSNNELSSQYSVRAGNFDENLVYINDVEIYRPNLINSGEQEGLSLINAQMVSSLQFSPGGFSAKYGDKLSSVLDVKYKRPSEFAASISASILGISGMVSDRIINSRLSYMIGFRAKSNTYLLNSLDTKGNYKPFYSDLQAMLNYTISDKISAEIWVDYNNNKYEFTPSSRETSFGTIHKSAKLKIFFEGKELDIHKYNIEAGNINYKSKNFGIKLMASRYTAREKETYDILGEYYLQDLFESQGGNSMESINQLGIGRYINHARNKLKQNISTVKLKSYNRINNLLLEWGLSCKNNNINDNINEWQYRDSAGYSLPMSSDKLLLANSRKSNNTIEHSNISSYIQVTYSKIGDFNIQLGLRHMYWTYNNTQLLSPRLNINYIPKWNNNLRFKLSVGRYNQTPNYREMLDINGQISDNIKVQKSIHYSLSQDYYFTLGDRPFKFYSEIYYKDLQNITPYDLENVRIRYYGNKKSKAYTYGIDLRLNGEFIPGTESWISLSVLRSREKAFGKTDKFIARPNDQLINFSMLFQDYLPNNPSYKMQLSLHYSSGLPVWAPGTYKQTSYFRMPSYRRVDLGLSKDFLYSKKIKYFKSLSLGMEIFNLFNINNTISYLWVKDIHNNQYAIPNYLTSRKINITINATF